MKSARPFAPRFLLLCVTAWFALAGGACSNAGPEKSASDGIGSDDTGSEESAMHSRRSRFNALTRNYNDQRTGANLRERTLDTSNVSKKHFGKLFELAVDDQVFAGVLYASKVRMSRHRLANLDDTGEDDEVDDVDDLDDIDTLEEAYDRDRNGSSGHRRHRRRNVLYVATVNNTVYAFDADVGGSPFWQRNFNNGFRPVFHNEVGHACGTNPDGTSAYMDMSGNIGIDSTPVIDKRTKTLFVVTRTVEAGTFVQRLRALDIKTGADRVPAVPIGTINPQTNNQHAALALSEGKIYVAWGSHCDTQPYHGRAMAFDSSNLAEAASFDVVPNGSMSGIWMSGAGPVVDRHGNLFYATGNGSFNGTTDFGQSIIKLNEQLGLVDYFTPSNFATLNARDNDLGSAGPIVVPGTNLIVMGGKGGGTCYLVSMNGMGGLVAGDRQIPQKWQCVDSDNIRPTARHDLQNAMVAWRSPSGVNVYTWGEGDFGRAWRFNGSTFDTPAVSVSNVLPPLGHPGGMMTLSAQGSRPGTGILWASMPAAGDSNQSVVPGVLRAFDAENLAVELWNSNLLPEDDSKAFSKSSIPVVGNGKVYLGSLANTVSVYGLRRLRDPRTNNLALKKPVVSGGSCGANEGPTRAVNGSVSLGNSDKYCSFDNPSFLQVDLGSFMTVNRFIVRHAGAGAENTVLNTRDFTISISDDAVAFTPVVTVTGNVQDVTVHDFGALRTRFVRLEVTVPTSVGNPATRIYELEVYGPRGGCRAENNADFCARVGKNCGTVTDSDNCGTFRTVNSCGRCSLPETCGGDGRANICGDPVNRDRTEGGSGLGSGQACGDPENATMAYDNLMTPDNFTKWCVFAVPTPAAPISTLYDFVGTDSYAINRYAITSGNDAEDRAPRDWVFQGCQGLCTVGSDAGWITLDTQTGQFVGAATFTTNTYSFANATAFQQYRLRITANNGSGNILQLTEIQMFGAPGSVGGLDRTEGGTPSSTAVECSDSEDAGKAYDNRMSASMFTKWCLVSAPSATVPISTTYDFAGTIGHAITSYTITTANDVPIRDPRDWTFQGCDRSCAADSDAGWITLDTQTNQFMGADRFQTRRYAITNTTAFVQYRFRFTANNGSATRFQLSELQLF